MPPKTVLTPAQEQLKRLQYEARWLRDNPQFEERPASIEEFFGPNYLNIEGMIRPGLRDALVDIFGSEPCTDRVSKYERAMVTGGIGIGKTTFASIALPYMAHWALCLKDPQKYFGLLDGSRIAFMQMSTSEKQVLEVVFGDIFARIDNSNWFRKFPRDPKLTRLIKFPKSIWIIPGDSTETSFEGYNILGGILDEMDSHRVTAERDYAEIGYDCADAATEILSKRGWLTHDQLTTDDMVLTLNHATGQSEWNAVEEVKRYDVKDESLVLMEGMEFSALTTRNHRWPVVHPNKGRQWTTSETFAFYDSIVTCAENACLPTKKELSDEIVELVAWAYTEGSINNGYLHLYQKTGRETTKRIENLLTRTFGVECVIPMRTGSVGSPDPLWRKYEYWNKDLTSFQLNGTATNEVMVHLKDKVPTHEFLLSLTQSQLELFLEISLVADNCGVNKFAQKDSRRTEAFAFAAILAGKTVSIRPHYSGVDHSSSNLLARILKKKGIKPRASALLHPESFFMGETKYTGIVWCPKTENKSWFARRNGSVYFTGNTIESRISSRFIDPSTNTHKGLLICIGQMKKSSGFAARKYNEMMKDPHAHVTRMSIWESLGWHRFLNKAGRRDSFWYDPARKNIVPELVVKDLQTTEHLIEVPNAYRHQFNNNPQKALRDLAGIPPMVEDAFITREDRVLSAAERWIENHYNSPSPVSDHTYRSSFADWFQANGHPAKRVMHIDLATSGDGDAVGIAMGHVREMIIQEGERKPYIVIDFIMRIKAPSGTQVMLSDVRSLVYHVRDDLGFRLKVVTMDGFNSTDTFQQLRKHRFQADYLSTDKSMLPYEDLRDAIYEERIEWPPYVTYLVQGDLVPVAILNQELMQLQDTGKKVDHPPKGSKDCSDAVAGVVTTLMGDRTYHKGVASRISTSTTVKQQDPFDPVVIAQNKEDQRQEALAALNRPPSLGIYDTIASPFEIQVPARLRHRN